MDKNGLRQQNLSLLRRTLKELRLATKPQLSEASGLSVVTVNSLVKELVERDEAQVVEEVSSTGGRPAVQYRFYAERRLALVGYMYEQAGVDQLYVMLVNLLGEPLTLLQERFPAVRVDMDFLVGVLRPYLQQYPAISTVLIGLPGVETAGRLKVVDYPALMDCAFSEEMSSRLQKPVQMVNDINATVVGLGASLGAVSQKETVLGVYWPQDYPPGAGILIRGQLYTGRDGVAGEIGHRFGRPGRVKQQVSHQAEVMEMTELLTRMWNPHRLVFYDEQLTEAAIAEIQAGCRGRIPIRFLPELSLRTSIHQDYRRGMCLLAESLLENGRTMDE